jgi:solute carrier family 25 carnitine/acylcarnitine transporter 20/29
MAADVQGRDNLKEAAPLKLQESQTKKKANDYKGFIAGVFSGIAKLSGKHSSSS